MVERLTISELAMQAKADAALVVDRHVNPSQKKASLALYGVEMWQAAGFLGMTVEMLERSYGHHHNQFMKQAADAVTRRRA